MNDRSFTTLLVLMVKLTVCLRRKDKKIKDRVNCIPFQINDQRESQLFKRNTEKK